MKNGRLQIAILGAGWGVTGLWDHKMRIVRRIGSAVGGTSRPAYLQ